MNRFDIGSVLFRQRRAVIAFVLAVTIGGIVSWRVMPKEEDPSLTERYGSILVSYPGADPETIEDLIIVPIEDEVRIVDGVVTVEAEASAGVAVIFVELDGTITETDPYWSDVETALDRAQREFPDGASEPDTSWEVMDLEGIQFAVTGSGSFTELWQGAEILADHLRGISGVKRVEITPEVDRRIGVAVDDSALTSVGLSRTEIVDQIGAGLGVVPGGSVRLGDQEAIVDPQSSIEDIESLRSFPIVVAGGAAVPLEALAMPTIEAARPNTATTRYNGAYAVMVGVVPQGEIDGVRFGKRVTAAADQLEERIAELGLEVKLASYQPGWIESRLDELLRSLLLGIAIVAAIVVLSMGVRLGLTVAVMVPVVTLAGVLVYAASGGILNQISIAALVMALGLLVDNAIVVSERIQWFLDDGMDRMAAAGAAVRELFVPLAAATGTTLAAYLPLLLARGETSEFTSAIPIVAMLTLSLSFVFAIIVTPTIAMLTLRKTPVREGEAKTNERGARLPRALADFSLRRPYLVVALTILVVPLVAGLISRVEITFFPDVDRNQMVVDVELPRDRNIDATATAVRKIERLLLDDERVESIISAVGRSVPPFYYNVLSQSDVPYFGQLLVTTHSDRDVGELMTMLRGWSRSEIPGASVVASRLAQGPGVDAPIEVRILAEEYEDLAREVALVKDLLRDIPGTVDVRSTLAPSASSYRLVLDDGAIIRQALSRGAVAREVLAVTRGLEAGSITIGEDSVPVVVTSAGEENTPATALTQTMVRSLRSGGGLVPLSSFARMEATTTPTRIIRRNGERTAAVLSQLEPGVGYNSVLAELRNRLPEPDTGVTVQIGGAAEESSAANNAIAAQAMVGVAVLLGILLIQFASIRRVLIILITVPLASVGVIPGLVIFHQPFGFTSMLGAIALIGIVVNNAIILVDLMDRRMKEGASQEEAIRSAVVERFRPILLTAGTTIAGMVPLLLTSSSLWPPFASAIISGLAVSTVLTLVVVPAAYRLMINAPRDRRVMITGNAAAFVLLIGASLLVPRSVAAQETVVDSRGAVEPLELTIEEIAERVLESATVVAAGREVAATEYGVIADRRAVFLPTLAAESETLRRNEPLTVDYGEFLGTSEQEPEWEGSVTIAVSQPVFDLEGQLGTTVRNRWELSQARAHRDQEERSYLLETLETALEGARMEARIASYIASREALSSNVESTRRLVAAGRATRVEGALVEVELERLDQQIASLEVSRQRYALDLGRAIGVTGEARLADSAVPEPVEIGGAIRDEISVAVDHPLLMELSASIRVIEASERELRLAAIPTVSLEGRATRAYNSGLDQEYWFEGAIVGQWVPFAAGERDARRRGLIESRMATVEQLDDTSAVLENAARSYHAQVVTALSRVEVEERAVLVYEQRREEVDLFLTQGSATTTDLLDADADLRAARRALADARIDAALALFRYRSVSGRPII